MIAAFTMSTLALAQDLSGFAEVRGQYSGGLEGTPWQAAQLFRPTFEVQPTERIRIAVTPQLELVEGRYNLKEGYQLVDEQLGSMIDAADCSLDAPDRYVSTDDVLSVERLYVDLYLPHVDVRVGRQALNWGSALFINPTDLFAEVLFTEPWRQRAGVDAIRATVPIGERHQVVGVAALTNDLEQGRFGLKGTFNALETDFSALGAVTTDGDAYAGIDLRGQLVLGWWLEGRTSIQEPAPILSVGVDYSFDVLDQLYVAAQYSYDGTGLEDPALYSYQARGLAVAVPDCLSDQLDQQGVSQATPRFTLGRHYALLTTRLAAFDNWSGSATAIMNLQDQSTLLIPTLTWAPGAAFTLNGGAQLPIGEGELSPGPTLTTVPMGPTELDVSGLVPDWTTFLYVRYAL